MKNILKRKMNIFHYFNNFSFIILEEFKICYYLSNKNFNTIINHCHIKSDMDKIFN